MFFLFIFISMLILGLAIHTSKIGIEIENLIIDTEASQKINEQSKIYVYLLIFNKIKLFKKNVKNMKMPKLIFKNKDIDIKVLKNKYLEINYIELLKDIDVDTKQLDLYAQIGTQDAALTAILVGIVSTMLGVILKKPKYQIIPIYSDKNLLKIKLDGIFTVNLMHYIYKIIFRKILKRKKETGVKFKLMEV